MGAVEYPCISDALWLGTLGFENPRLDCAVTALMLKTHSQRADRESCKGVHRSLNFENQMIVGGAQTSFS